MPRRRQMPDNRRMNCPRVRALPLAFSLMAFAPAAAWAQSADTVDVALWTLGLATVRLSENYRLHLEEQARFNNNISDLDQNILRGALGRKVHERFTVWGGYAWVARFAGERTRHEQRIWEQLSVTLPDAGAWKPSLRLRLEQRFLDGWDGSSVRLRTMARGVRPLDEQGTWSIAAWDELMFTLDETTGGPAQGFDQNRLFGGVLRKLSPRAGVEFGYMWQAVNQPGALPTTNTHIVFVWLNLTL